MVSIHYFKAKFLVTNFTMLNPNLKTKYNLNVALKVRILSVKYDTYK